MTVRDGCCIGVTGNIDCGVSEIPDVGDLTKLIEHVFITFEELCCPEEANVSGDPGGDVDVTDLTALINHLFISYEPVAGCQ